MRALWDVRERKVPRLNGAETVTQHRHHLRVLLRPKWGAVQRLRHLEPERERFWLEAPAVGCHTLAQGPVPRHAAASGNRIRDVNLGACHRFDEG